MKCVLDENKLCDDCRECDACDLNKFKLCDNCYKCINGSGDYSGVIIDEIITDE